MSHPQIAWGSQLGLPQQDCFSQSSLRQFQVQTPSQGPVAWVVMEGLMPMRI